MKKSIYLDYAAATPMDAGVRKAMEPYFEKYFYNPSATYLGGLEAKKTLTAARAGLARILGARPTEIIFTAGATEANNLAIQGVLRSFPGAEVLVSAVEHESVLAPAGLFTRRDIPVDQNGIIILNKLSKLITDKTVLVSIMLVNNELGTVQPLREVAGLIKQIRVLRRQKNNTVPLYLHTDAAQAGNCLDLHTARLGVDLMSLNGGKIYGPKQSGALFVKTGVRLEPLIVGGGQELGLRAGTENVAAAVGFGTALELAQDGRLAEAARLNSLRKVFASQLQKRLPGAVINSLFRRTAPHILSVTFPGVDNERLMMQLDDSGVIAAVGSACSARSEQPSHVLTAIGLSDAAARSTLRFSLGRKTDETDLVRAADLVSRFAYPLR